MRAIFCNLWFVSLPVSIWSTDSGLFCRNLLKRFRLKIQARTSTAPRLIIIVICRGKAKKIWRRSNKPTSRARNGTICKKNSWPFFMLLRRRTKVLLNCILLIVANYLLNIKQWNKIYAIFSIMEFSVPGIIYPRLHGTRELQGGPLREETLGLLCQRLCAPL